MYITIDPYYDARFYHECCSALKNNGVPYTLYVSTRPPYNWYFKVADENAPKFINFDTLDKSEQKYLVSCTQPSSPVDIMPLYRRKTGIWVDEYFMCNAYKDCLEKDCIVFTLDNRDEAMELSKYMRVYFLGKYRQFKFFMCNNRAVQNYVPRENIIFRSENTTVKDLQKMEMKINYDILLPFHIKLEKYVNMPYFENRQYFIVLNSFVNKNRFKFA